MRRLWSKWVAFMMCGLVFAGLWVAHRPVSNNPATASTVPEKFIVFDATLYQSKPDLSRFGLKSLRVIYVTEFGEQWYNSPARMQLPQEDSVKRLATKVASTEELVAIDIEHWPLTGDASTVQESINKYRQIAKWFHKAAPAMHIGFFGIVPMAAYGWSLKGPESTEYKSWQQINDGLIPIAREVDAIFPHAYTYYPDQEAWVRYATENIKEARRYGKPVYVFLWPRYESTPGRIVRKDLQADYWELQLETVRKLADGLVIWGGWGDTGPEQWNDDAPWWQVTKRFLNRIDTVAPARPKDFHVQ